jgi:hypothetical protein
MLARHFSCLLVICARFSLKLGSLELREPACWSPLSYDANGNQIGGKTIFTMLFGESTFPAEDIVIF